MRLVPLVALFLAACVADGTPPPANSTPADLAARFEQAIFPDPSSGTEHLLVRTEGVIRWAIDAGDFEPRTSKFLPDITETIDEFERLTGTPIEADATKPNLVLIMRDRTGNVEVARQQSATDTRFGADHPTNVQWASCSSSVFTDTAEPGTVTSALIFVHADLPDRHFRQCIVHRIASVFGVFFAIADPDGTAFSPNTTRTTLSDTDRKLIQILYDDRLRSGMTRAEAMPIVREIIAERGW